MGSAERGHRPATVLLDGDQCTNADDRVKDVFREFVAHRGTDLVVASAAIPVGSGKALEVGDRFEIPNDETTHGPYLRGWMREVHSQPILQVFEMHLGPVYPIVEHRTLAGSGSTGKVSKFDIVPIVIRPTAIAKWPWRQQHI
jgi:hypothetical protein